MNKIQLIRQSKFYIFICRLLFEFDSIDFVKLCFMTFVISQERTSKHINDFFNIIGNNYKIKQKDLITIKECVFTLEQNEVVSIINNKVTLIKDVDMTNFGSFQPTLIDILCQINSMSINSFVRMVAQYV